MPKGPTTDLLCGLSRAEPAPPSGADFGEQVERFEEAWQHGAPPRLDAFLPPAAESVRRALLIELIPIDLEYRWCRATPPDRPWVLEDYIAHCPDLGPRERMPAELIVEEYRARQRWGDAPSHESYAQRFPVQADQLGTLLTEMDARLAAEYAQKRPAQAANALPVAQAIWEGSYSNRSSDAPLAQPVPVAVLTIDSVATLLSLLRDSQVLSAKQLHELSDSAGQFSEPRALARHLMERGWLTPFQANQFFLGRSRDLNLGPYLLLERIGAGLTGEVFKARHLRMDTRVVALKVIRKELLQDADAVRRFYKEIEAAGRLSHPNVIHPYDAGPIGQTHFLAMEYVEGINLARLVKESGPLPVLQACAFIRQVALGLQCVQEHGLVHRDIKPSNLVVSAGKADATHTDPPVVKILDLGLARVWSAGANSSSTLTLAGAFLGTPDFMAPEQALDPHAADIRSDLYSLGCTFYYLLSGQPPFPGGTLIQKADRHRWEAPPPIEQFQRELPAEVSDLLRRMLAKQPKDRPQTPAEVAAELAPWSSAGHEVTWSDLALPVASARAGAASGGLSSKTQVLLTPGASPPTRWPFKRLDKLLAHRKKLVLMSAAGLLVCGVVLFLTFRQLSGSGHEVTGSAPTSKEPAEPVDLAQIPAAERYPRQPKELVGVLRYSGEAERLAKTFVFFSRDSRWLVGLEGNELVVWDLTTRSERTVLKGHAGPIRIIQFSSDSRQLMSVSIPPNAETRLWNLETGKEVHRIPGGRVGTYSPDGRHYACEDGKALVMYEIETDREVRRFHGHSTGIRAVRFDDRGRRVVTGAGVMALKDGKPVPVDCTTRLWDTATGKELGSFGPHPWPVDAVWLSFDGRRIYSSSTDDKGQVTVGQWDVAKNRAMCKLEGEHAASANFSPDGRWLLVHHGKKVPELVDVDAGPGKPAIVLAEFPQGTASTGFGPDGTLASIHFDGRVIFWEPHTGRRLRVFDLPAPGRTGNFSIDGRYFAACTDKGRIYIFRLTPATIGE